MTDTFAKTLAMLDDIANRISTTDAYQRGQIKERAALAAWLRSNAMGPRWRELADAIEAGEHLK